MNNTVIEKCPSCGENMFFNTSNQLWECNYCKRNDSYNEIQGIVPETSIKNFVTYKCCGCGVEIIGGNDAIYMKCSFCGCDDIKKEPLLNDAAPNYVLPFKINKDEAASCFSKLLSGKFLASRKFKKICDVNEIFGIYVPFWVYDLEVNGEVEFEASDLNFWKDNNFKYAKTSRYSIRKSGHLDFNKVLVDASVNLSSEVMDYLEPYDFSDIVLYDSSYLTGYFIDRYDIDAKSGVDMVSSELKNISIDMIQRTVEHQNVAVVRDGLMVSSKYTNYVLLPVWMVNVNYKGKKHMFLLNGQTGKVFGNVVIGVFETIMCFLIIFSVVFGILYLISMFR